MTNRLLNRQASLIEYLTSDAAIFGEEDTAPLPQGLSGLDRRLLHLEARFSYEKRMEKIAGVFARTLGLLGDDVGRIIRDFVATCPPVDISRLANARQFHDFLLARWRAAPPMPPYLPDVAACELACAAVRVETADRLAAKASGELRTAIRRCSHVVLRRCAYDVRSIFEEHPGDATPTKRDTPLAISMPAAAHRPSVFEVLPVVFDLLSVLDDWSEPGVFGDTPQMEAMIRDLVEHGLIEIRP